MRVGVAFPQSEIGSDPAVIRDFAQLAEELGYDHVTCIDHVIQEAVPPSPDWRSYYTRDHQFHEPLVLFGFMAAATRRVELATAILILPQRPAVLVAKQAAEVDVLSGGRLRLGVGIGWNEIEFEALGQSYKTRARRMEEQIALMRRLWTEELVSFEGAFHKVTEGGLNPMPVQRPIPVWIGAFAEPAIRRAGRLGDGWFANPRKNIEQTTRDIQWLREAAVSAGRDPTTVGIDCTVHIGGKGPDDWAREAEGWKQIGATHVTCRTMYAGLTRPDQHFDAIRRFAEAVLPRR